VSKKPSKSTRTPEIEKIYSRWEREILSLDLDTARELTLELLKRGEPKEKIVARAHEVAQKPFSKKLVREIERDQKAGEPVSLEAIRKDIVELVSNLLRDAQTDKKLLPTSPFTQPEGVELPADFLVPEHEVALRNILQDDSKRGDFLKVFSHQQAALQKTHLQQTTAQKIIRHVLSTQPLPADKKMMERLEAALSPRQSALEEVSQHISFLLLVDTLQGTRHTLEIIRSITSRLPAFFSANYALGSVLLKHITLLRDLFAPLEPLTRTSEYYSMLVNALEKAETLNMKLLREHHVDKYYEHSAASKEAANLVFQISKSSLPLSDIPDQSLRDALLIFLESGVGQSKGAVSQEMVARAWNEFSKNAEAGDVELVTPIQFRGPELSGVSRVEFQIRIHKKQKKASSEAEVKTSLSFLLGKRFPGIPFNFTIRPYGTIRHETEEKQDRWVADITFLNPSSPEANG
jgi:hypothetical protein